MATGGGWRVNRIAFGSVFVQHLPLLSSRHSLFWGCWEGCSQGPYTLRICLRIPRIWLHLLMWGDRRSTHNKTGCKSLAEEVGCKSSVTWLSVWFYILINKFVIWAQIRNGPNKNSTGRFPGTNGRCELISLQVIYYALLVSKLSCSLKKIEFCDFQPAAVSLSLNI